MPLKNLNHAWTFADPTAPGHPYWHKTENTCYAGLIYCSVNVKETGIMTSTTRVNGVEHTDSVMIYCVETEPLLNYHAVRQGLLAMLDSSNAQNPDPALRSERSFFVLQDTVTPGAVPYIQILPRQPTDNVCQFDIGPNLYVPLPWSNRKVLAWGHDHPSEPGVDVTCTNSNGTVTGTGTTVDVATADDWEVANDYNDSLKNPGFAYKGWLPESGLIIDLHKLMVLRPGQAGGSETAAGNAFNWDRGLCAWPKGSI